MKRTFLVGCPRSGTTIVQAMLAMHPAVCALPETAFFELVHGDLAWRWGDAQAVRQPLRPRQHIGLSRKRERQRLLAVQRTACASPVSTLQPSLFRSLLQKQFMRLLDATSEAAGRSMWLEQTPSHLLYLPEIEALAPDARFVHVIRPGADVIASLADASLLPARDDTFGGGTVHWARRWHRAMQIHRQYLGHPRHHLLFLEDLAAQPQQAWMRLCEFLGLDPAQSLDDSCARAIADLEQVPWKRRAAPMPEAPREAAWLQGKLASYDELRAQWLLTRGPLAPRRSDRQRSALPGG